MIDIKLRKIISDKPAGTYFIVNDNSAVQELMAETKMPIVIGSFETGMVNVLVKFAKGDIATFRSVFGRTTRSIEKKGNFSHSVVEDILKTAPCAVLNIRAFDDEKDKAGIYAMSVIDRKPESKEIPYRRLFNTNTFWTPATDEMPVLFDDQKQTLNFGNVATNNISIFIVKSKDVKSITSEYDETLGSTSLEIDDYPALKPETKLADTIVDVYLFNNHFSKGSNTNKYYGHLFSDDNELDIKNIDKLTEIEESGFVRKFTGTVIPGVKNELGEEISIDVVVNQYYLETGLLCNINEDAFEVEDDIFSGIANFSQYYDLESLGIKEESFGTLLSYYLPPNLTKYVIPTDPEELKKLKDDLVELGKYNLTEMPITVDELNVIEKDGVKYASEIMLYREYGITVDSKFVNGDDVAEIVSLTPLGEEVVVEDDGSGKPITLDKLIVKLSALIDITNMSVVMIRDIYETCRVKAYNMISYKPRAEQFVDGTASRQSEILDMMLNPGIVKGLVGTRGLRYVVDPFKSFVENSYKSQIGELINTLDDKNRFLRAIINEPFISDIQKSTNPLFRNFPNGDFSLEYLNDGGNKNYSTKLLTKFSKGAGFCFFFGPGDKYGNVIKPLSGKVASLFYAKTQQFDIVANETGYVDNINELEYPFDDDERKFLENFLYNPIIQIGNNVTIYGNTSGQKKRTTQQQIHNSELLCYIKQTLYDMSMKEAFKKSGYNDYLTTQTECQEFMNSLALAGAIDANPIVICSPENNPKEITRQRVKLVRVEYVPMDANEKIVFELNIE